MDAYHFTIGIEEEYMVMDPISRELKSQPYPGALGFRIAETPVFLPGILNERLVEACEGMMDTLMQPGFSQLTDSAIPATFGCPATNAVATSSC